MTATCPNWARGVMPPEDGRLPIDGDALQAGDVVELVSQPLGRVRLKVGQRGTVLPGEDAGLAWRLVPVAFGRGLRPHLLHAHHLRLVAPGLELAAPGVDGPGRAPRAAAHPRQSPGSVAAGARGGGPPSANDSHGHAPAPSTARSRGKR